jgi:cytochrome c-type biogenesis protein CcmH/NrfG
VDLARVYILADRTAEGKEVLQYCLALDASHPVALLILGLLRIEEGDVERGTFLLREFREYHPKTPEAVEVRETLREIEAEEARKARQRRPSEP